MKTKIYLFALLFVCSCATIVVASEMQSIRNEVALFDEGEVRPGGGTLSYEPVASPIKLYQTGNSSLEARYLTSLGEISVVITNSSGTSVYNKKVNASAESNLLIDISGYASGSYTIKFIDSNNGIIKQGTFTIE